jgi:Zn-dependent metalloprotease
MSRSGHAVCCFLPPHILRNIAERGETGEREHAYAALEAASESRGQRSTTAAEVLTRAVPKQRRVFDGGKARRLPGRLLREEGAPACGDRAADEAYAGTGTTIEFFREVLGRDSIDGRGMRVDSTVHYGVGYSNAMWNGRQMIYGDGDGRLFRRFTVALDVIAHELTHGMSQHCVSFDSDREAGALNEHVSDVFGVLVQQYAEKQSAARADWLVGAGIFMRRVHGSAVRSMKAPGTAYDDPLLGRDPQPSHMRDYLRTEFDNGGVHINSGIPNHAFYRAATAIGGNAWELAGKIWYRTLASRVRHDSTFAEFAGATAAVTTELCGATSREHAAVVDAWSAVGIDVNVQPVTRPRARVFKKEARPEA